MHRRDFLRSAGAAIVTGLPRCASAPRRHLDRIGLQLYTVRHDMARDLAGTLARVAAIGYQEVEFHDYFGHAPTAVRAALTAEGLDAPATHVDYSLLGDGWDGVLDAATTIGHRYVLVAWIPATERQDAAGWRRIAERFNRAGERTRAAGLRFGYHNHDYEFAPRDGAIPYDMLLAETDPALVTMEMDLYWITKGGLDPLTYFARHPGRFELVHVKDSAGPPEHRMVDLGTGTIDFASIAARSQQAGIRHWFVEHDEPADPFAFCRDGYAYLSTLEF